ncbi:DUF1684 domain-containing protein [Hyunsoonleella flava]|uniref:DUF1684 domain-containing protein n=1 Tax=Hyunsoonleella flava TaxID=2527939 RepID=A0A4Q9FHF8_9FLAO|nr:DUF1684 domain-containing protein [Hyunsoonleella flava]TBN06739.1 DUF1684 domain-containing protein [Hyunsoonleella flava]
MRVSKVLQAFWRYPQGVGLSLLALCEELKHAVQSLTRAYQPKAFRTLASIILALVFTATSCTQKKRPLKGETTFQKELNAFYKDASTSPLKKKDLKTFEGLDFFKYDSSYVVTAKLKRTPDSEWFNMKTTTQRVSEERVYGILYFELHGKQHQLNIYQGKDAVVEGDDYLFLPFLDETNGLESYGGGRYIDANIPEGDSIIIDFNSAYNPYCAYNDKYSCPIVPRENYLKTRVEAGVKAFEKH